VTTTSAPRTVLTDGTTVEEVRELLDAVTYIQRLYVHDRNSRDVFDAGLLRLLELTGSEYGFITELAHTDVGEPFLRSLAISNISWDEASRTYYETALPVGLEFHNRNSLFGTVMTTGQLLLTDDAANHPAAAGVPPGHPALVQFAGIPLRFAGSLVGVIGLANRPGGSTETLVTTLDPIVTALGNLISESRRDRDRSRARRDLAAATVRLSALISRVSHAVLVEDETRHVVLANEAFVNMFHVPVPPDMLTGANCETMAAEAKYAFADPDTFIKRIDRLLADGIAVSGDLLHTADGRVLERDFVPVSTDAGRLGMMWLYRDVTDRVKAENARIETLRLEKEARARLEEQNERLAELSQLKDDFVTTVSHELRTPLTSILLWTDILSEEATTVDEVTRSHISTVAKHAGRLQRIVDDLLTIGKNERGAMQLVPVWVNVPALVREAIADAQQAGVVRGITVEAEIGEGPDAFWDADRIRQVIDNLVGNACKFTPAGGRVQLQVWREDNDWVLRIEDSGPGIDPELVPRLFDPFARGANVGAVSGTGLGLAVCRAIVSLHAGTVDVEPIERRSVSAQPALGGAVFVVRLPIHALTTEAS